MTKQALCLFLCALLLGCVSGRYRYVAYNPDGSIKSETDVKYKRFMNQKIGMGKLKTGLFEAELLKQEADNTEAVKAGAEGFVKGVTAIATLEDVDELEAPVPAEVISD